MRRLTAVALVVGMVAAPAFAQRGGGHGGSFHEGFGGHSAYTAHAGYSGTGAPRPGNRFGNRSHGSYGRVYSAAPLNAAGRPAGIPVGRPAYGRRGDWNPGVRRRRDDVPYVNPYGYAGWGDAGYLWNPDDGFDDDDTASGPADDPNTGAEGYDAQQPPPDPGQREYPSPPYAASRADQGSPSQQEQPRNAATDQTVALYDSDAVTLVFKDGRPPEKIHNYALTRTMLYVTDAHRQEIPVAELNLAATQKTNREAGVTFQLPQAGQ